MVKNATKARQDHFSKKGKVSTKQFVLISSPPEKKKKKKIWSSLVTFTPMTTVLMNVNKTSTDSRNMVASRKCFVCVRHERHLSSPVLLWYYVNIKNDVFDHRINYKNSGYSSFEESDLVHPNSASNRHIEVLIVGITLVEWRLRFNRVRLNCSQATGQLLVTTCIHVSFCSTLNTLNITICQF